jgi:signal transduction histidine kinase
MKPSYEVKCNRKDRTVFWAELKIKHLSKGNKSFGSLSDITARKLSENQMKDSERLLMRSNAAKDKLFSIISHDLKTPFNTLMGYTYLLMKEYGHYDEEKRETMIRSLYDVTKQTFNMLENILVWSRSQTGGIPFVPRGISISKLLIENIRLYMPTAKAKCISLTLDQELHEVIVFADPDMIQTVIRNLVTNAIKFTPEKGRVSLGLVDDDEEKITVYVKDDGVGIEPDKIDHLFHIDNNYSTRGTNDEKGTGLGLTVCREFVEKNGGEIWIDSTPGKGSCFYFSLYKKVEEVL